MAVTMGYAAMFEQFTRASCWITEAGGEGGFTAIMASDHFQPWVPSQGHSGFVWSWIGARRGDRRRCASDRGDAAGFRYHPAIVAQAAATLGAMTRDASGSASAPARR